MAMKSIVLILWLVAGNGHDELVYTGHVDDQPACEAKAAAFAEQYVRQGRKTRHLCHAVIEEVGDVDENGNPLK
jgi:hypothetical protein